MENLSMLDTKLKKELTKLIDKHYISTVIETGSGKGSTTADLAEIAPFVYAIDSTAANVLQARKALINSNVSNAKTYHGNPAGVIKIMHQGRRASGNILFFLASGDKLNEVGVIKSLGLKGVFVIQGEYSLALEELISSLYPNGTSKKTKKSNKIAFTIVEPKEEAKDEKPKKSEPKEEGETESNEE